MKSESWRELVLESLKELSDSSFQERVWLRCEGNAISSPIETINQLFDDSGLGELLERGTVFSESADSTLGRLSELIDTVDFNRPIEDVMADDRWLEVRRLALRARTEIHAAIRREEP